MKTININNYDSGNEVEKEADNETEEILNLIDNDKYDVLIDKNSKNIATIKNDMLQKLQLNKVQLKAMHKKLKDYQYVDELPDIHVGHYVRWISLKNENNIRLTNGGIIVSTQITGKGVSVTIKNNINRIITVYIDNVLLFQKITPQEQIIINIMDYLET
tara:strand:- start:897 stop:1376 length:480 start_codon:yes stop_codon:yes gene_type:complete